MGQNTDSIWTAAPSLYSLIIVKVIELEKVTFSDMEVLRLFFKGPTADDKHSLLSRGNLMQRIQMDLSQELKNFNQLFFAFFKSKLNFE